MAGGRKLEAHVFVCCNMRDGDRRSCGKSGGAELRDRLKALCAEPGREWAGRVRINQAGCLGRCEEGLVAVIYPQGEWFTSLKPEDSDRIMASLSEFLD